MRFNGFTGFIAYMQKNKKKQVVKMPQCAVSIVSIVTVSIVLSVGKPQLVSNTKCPAERKDLHLLSQNSQPIVGNKIFFSLNKTDEAKTYRGSLF